MHVYSARGLALLTGAALALPCGSGSSWGAEPPVRVVASTNVYGDLVEQIGGDRADVVSIMSDPAQDPHSYEASTRTRLELSRAAVVVHNGGGYDDFVGSLVRSAKNSSAEVVTAVDVSGKAPAGGGEFNEHVWYDFPTMGKLADRIADALTHAAPADADVFQENAKTFKDELTLLRSEAERIKADHAGRAVAVTEPVPLHLIEASGLRNSTPADFSQAVEEGDEVSPRSLQQTLDLFTGKKVAALVYNEQTSGPQTERVRQAAEDNGIPVVPVTETLPPHTDYIRWMTAQLHALKGALGT